MRFPEFSGEWEEHTLSEYLEFKNGLNPDAKRIGSGLPFISVMDILSEGVINYDNIRGKVNATEKEIECFGVKDGDLLFQRSSETLEDVGRANVYMDNRTAIYGGFVIRGRKIGNYDPLFFKYLFWVAIRSSMRDRNPAIFLCSSIDGKYNDILDNPSCPILKCCAPAPILQVLLRANGVASKIIEKLQSLIKGLSQQLLSSENDWILYRLDDLAQIKSGYSGIQVSYQTPYKVSRIETISKHCIDIQRIGYVEFIPESYKLNVGNILFSNINSVQYIGNTAYLDEDYGLYHGMNLLRIIPNTTIVRPRFLHLLLCTDWAINHFQTICNKAVSQASINQTALGKSRYPIPPMSVQQQICSMFELTERKLGNEQEYISCLQQQKRYLLQEMFI